MLSRCVVLLFFIGGFLNLTESTRWISNEELFYDDNSTLMIYNVRTQEKSRVNTLNTSSVTVLSDDLRYTAEFVVARGDDRNPSRQLFLVLIHNNSNAFNFTLGLPSNDDGKVQAFAWSHGSAFIFQQSNGSVYYSAGPGKTPTKITEEEANMEYDLKEYSRQSSDTFFSPSDNFLSFRASAKVNDTKKAFLTTYTRGDAYDYNYQIDYIKPGESLPPAPSIAFWSVAEKKMIMMDVQTVPNTIFPYIIDESWVVLHGREVLVVIIANRWFNHTAINICSYYSTSCSLLYEHRSEPGQWTSEYENNIIVYSNSSIFFILPEAKGNNSWQHIAKLDVSNDFKLEGFSFLPSGNYDVKRIVAYRPYEDAVIYQAQAPNPWNMHVYATPAQKGSLLEDERCLTCVSERCSYQGYFVASRGVDFQIALTCQGPSRSFQAVISFNETLQSVEFKNITEQSSENIPKWITESFMLSNGYEAIVRVFEGNLSLSSVPVTLNVYGGPLFNMVTDRFDEMLLEDDNAIVKIDVRGAEGRGWKYRSAIYRGLVTVEVEDTIEAMKMVLDKYPRLDRTRVGVHGWSYGGTMTTALVEKAPPRFFKCAVVGAPVTNFIYYTAIYAERYMGDAPLAAYIDLNRNVTAFRDTKLLLVHGLRDDNVLFQNSAFLIESLQKENIQFELMVYPNKGHYFPSNDNHYKQLFESFFTTCYA